MKIDKAFFIEIMTYLDKNYIFANVLEKAYEKYRGQTICGFDVLDEKLESYMIKTLEIMFNDKHGYINAWFNKETLFVNDKRVETLDELWELINQE